MSQSRILWTVEMYLAAHSNLQLQGFLLPGKRTRVARLVGKDGFFRLEAQGMSTSFPNAMQVLAEDLQSGGNVSTRFFSVPLALGLTLEGQGVLNQISQWLAEGRMEAHRWGNKLQVVLSRQRFHVPDPAIVERVATKEESVEYTCPRGIVRRISRSAGFAHGDGFKEELLHVPAWLMPRSAYEWTEEKVGLDVRLMAAMKKALEADPLKEEDRDAQ